MEQEFISIKRIEKIINERINMCASSSCSNCRLNLYCPNHVHGYELFTPGAFENIDMFYRKQTARCVDCKCKSDDPSSICVTMKEVFTAYINDTAAQQYIKKMLVLQRLEGD